MKDVLLLPVTKLTTYVIGDKYNFVRKCKEYAEITYEFLCKMADDFNSPSYSAGEIIKGESFKKFINSNWKDSVKRTRIIEIFEKQGVEILIEEKNCKSWKKFKLKDEVYDKLFN